MFHPPRCPYRACPQHRRPEPEFFTHHGSYRPRCRPRPVPRFRCRGCRRTFSRQTFRADYHDRKPALNPRLFMLLASGVGLRQSARALGLSYRGTVFKARKIARHLRRLNLSLRKPLKGAVGFHFDELETYEGQRNTRPLTLPLLVHSQTRYIVWGESAPIRPRGTMTEKRLEAVKRSEKRHGVRRDLSRRSIRRTLNRGRAMVEEGAEVSFHTDEKTSYPRLIQKAFEGCELSHAQTNSELVRATWNPLFTVNHEEAMARDLMGRLRRESWLVTKRRRYLDLFLHVHMAFRNLVRRRFNRDEESAAQLLGFTPRRLEPHEVLSWRQDWGRRSIHPLSRRGRSVEDWRPRRKEAG